MGWDQGKGCQWRRWTLGIKRIQVAPPEKELISPELRLKLDKGEKTTKEKESQRFQEDRE